jgi:hypothetical protein
MPSRPRGPSRGIIVVAVVAAALVVALFARPLPDEQTPWEFLRNGAAHADSPGKRMALVFFTIVLMWMNFMAALARVRLGLLLPIVLGALLALTLVSPRVRQSRLVRVGFGLLAVGLIPLVVVGGLITDNPVGLGFLFAFLTPIAGLLILCGTVLALTTRQSHDRP